MREAILLSVESVARGGSPFGAVIVKDGEIIASRSNSVPLIQLLRDEAQTAFRLWTEKVDKTEY